MNPRSTVTTPLACPCSRASFTRGAAAAPLSFAREKEKRKKKKSGASPRANDVEGERSTERKDGAKKERKNEGEEGGRESGESRQKPGPLLSLYSSFILHLITPPVGYFRSAPPPPSLLSNVISSNIYV